MLECGRYDVYHMCGRARRRVNGSYKAFNRSRNTSIDWAPTMRSFSLMRKVGAAVMPRRAASPFASSRTRRYFPVSRAFSRASASRLGFLADLLQYVDIPDILALREISLKDRMMERLEPALFPGKFSCLEGQPRIRNIHDLPEVEAEGCAHAVQAFGHAFDIRAGEHLHERHALRRRLGMDLESQPFHVEGEFLLELVDKTHADVAVWSDVVGKDADGYAHRCLVVFMRRMPGSPGARETVPGHVLTRDRLNYRLLRRKVIAGDGSADRAGDRTTDARRTEGIANL